MHGFDWKVRIDNEHIRIERHACNRREAFDGIVRKLVECGIERMRDGDEQERVAVRRCVGSGLDPNDAAGAAAIVDNDLPAELLTELSGNGAADQVVSSAC